MLNIKLNYWAAQLSNVLVWVTINRETGWVNIEQISCPSISLEGPSLLSQAKRKKVQMDNEWIKFHNENLTGN